MTRRVPRLTPATLAACALCLWGSPGLADNIVPRTIIALYKGDDPRESFIHTLAEMPLNHLGLNVEYHDVDEPLPDLSKRKDVRGVFTWFANDVGLSANTYMKWAVDAIEGGKKFVIFGSLGISEGEQYFGTSALTNRFLRDLGIRIRDRWVARPFDSIYDIKTPAMFLDANAFNWIRPAYQSIDAENDTVRVHLSAHRSGTKNEDSVIVMTSPTGGYVNDDYAFRMSPHEEMPVNQWLIDPFVFFRAAFDTDPLPKPDTTTAFGRRLYYSHIDGDGWNNVTQIQAYRDKKVLSSEVVMEKAIKPFPDMPVMVAPIVADIDPQWVGTDRSRQILRTLWSLPQVEAGSHTYSHPFYWDFFKAGDPKVEIPYLPYYKTPVWRQVSSVAAFKKPTAEPLPPGYSVPRAFAVQPFDIHKEIEGSVDTLLPFLPKDKKIEILSWSGNCFPWESVVHKTRELKIQNLNGGDTRFDPSFPGYASVAPIGRQVGQERQIYASTSNENTYTNLWSEHFHAFGYLRQTFTNTETPYRLKPINIYYHMYSGEREASLAALLDNINYARRQPIMPVSASEFTRIAEGFYTTNLVSIGDKAWRVENRGELSTIRFDKGTFLAVDFGRSQGVLGQRRLQGSLYVALDPDAKTPVIALRNDERYYAQPEDKTAYLLSSRWRISGLKRSDGRIDFVAQGFGDGDMAWQMATPGAWRVTLNGKTTDVDVQEDRMLHVTLKESATTPVKISITRAPNVKK